ncbi:hypothetical protein D9O36_19940 [Zobellia amurskyensis]|uniref:Anti-sigma factor n=1 Tax=Zobellia amurskyensis TaxID=248905 RepID=A0A7X2ZXH7_9FLAO|nr:hypothetical protein [Zobellia amurskyensis]MUH38129.1 hypothetical protein [Zobellia amurskyensis]
MDNFEKHIRENRAAFDDHKADRAKLWANIEAKLDPPKPKVVPLWKSPVFRVAATVLIILGISSLIGITFLGSSANDNTFVSKELQDIDMHYQDLVSYQVQLVQKNENLSDADKAEFLSFMDDLDKEYDQLKLEMQNNLDNELVLEAIVSNYRKRIELIENLLRQLNESKLKDDDYGYTL